MRSSISPARVSMRCDGLRQRNGKSWRAAYGHAAALRDARDAEASSPHASFRLGDRFLRRSRRGDFVRGKRPGRGMVVGSLSSMGTEHRAGCEGGHSRGQPAHGRCAFAARRVLARLLPVARLGLGGPIGTGWQFMSVIAIDDLVSAIYHVLLNESLIGPVNIVGPRAIPQRELAKTLGVVLERPAVLRFPAFVAQRLFGEMADALLLSSARVEPRRLIESGFAFQFPELEMALRHLLGRTRRVRAGAER